MNISEFNEKEMYLKKQKALKKIIKEEYKNYYSKLLDEGDADDIMPLFKELREKNKNIRNNTIIISKVIDN